MHTYSNIHRARDVAETLQACFDAIPPEPISSESSGRSIADNLTKHALLTYGGDFGHWRPLPAGMYLPITSIAHFIAVVEYLCDVTISAATAEMVVAHLRIKADVAANLARLRLSARGVELAGDEYRE